MSRIFRSHLPYSQAHILAGALSSGGISAAVGGEMTAQIYGGTPLLDCTVLVPEDQVEEAEAFLSSDVSEEVPAPDIPAESCPPDGDPPGIGAILYGTLCLAPFAAVIPSLLTGMRILTHRIDSLEPVVRGVVFAYFTSLLTIVIALPLIAIGAGVLLGVIRGYRRGSRLCRMIVAVVIWILIVPWILIG